VYFLWHIFYINQGVHKSLTANDQLISDIKG